MIDLLKENEFDKLVIRSDRLVIIQFCTLWCGNCPLQETVLFHVMEENKDQIRLYRVIIEENQKLCNKLGITDAQQLLFFSKSKSEKKVTGLVSYNEIKDIINQIL